jgi:hypothetical protein
LEAASPADSLQPVRLATWPPVLRRTIFGIWPSAGTGVTDSMMTCAAVVPLQMEARACRGVGGGGGEEQEQGGVRNLCWVQDRDTGFMQRAVCWDYVLSWGEKAGGRCVRVACSNAEGIEGEGPSK